MDYFSWQTNTHPATHGLARQNEGTKKENDAEIRSLKAQVDRLTLACQSMWELIRDAGNFTEEELKSKIMEVDLRDGAPDGKLSSSVIKCDSCGRNTNSRRPACVWCGIEVERQHTFEG